MTISILLIIDNIHKVHEFCTGIAKFMRAGAVEAHGVAFIEDIGFACDVGFQRALLDKYIFLCVGGMAFGQVFFAGQYGHGEYVKTPLGCGREVTSGRK